MKVVFFSPHAGLWQHAFPEALVADALRSADAQLIYVTCDGAFATGCVTMVSRGVTAEASKVQRDAVCSDCRAARNRLRGGFDFSGYDLEAMVSSADEERIASLVARADPGNLADFVIDDIEIGRAALYEFLIERKKLHLSLTDEEWTLFRPRLVSTVRSLVAAANILDREQPDRVVVYNSLYSVNAAWRLAANKRDIPFFFVHGGLSLEKRLQKVIIGRDTTLDWWNRTIDAWHAYRDVPCHPGDLAQVTNHVTQVIRGTSVFAYSAPKARDVVDVRAKFGVRSEQKLLVATMSSYDEYVAAHTVGGVPDPSTLLFPTQIEWVEALSAWIRTRPDLFLLLRVHPREFPNKRDSRKSEHAAALERAFASLPDNVRVNWPADKLSIYDVAEQADVILNAWSSAGKEMALLGLPVVIYCPTVIQYPTDLNYVGTTHATYFAAIDRALRDGWSFERTRQAYRWCVLELVRGLADISDGFDFVEDPPRSQVERALRFVRSPAFVYQNRDLTRRPAQLAECRRLVDVVIRGKTTMLETYPRVFGDIDSEASALRVEVARLIHALYGSAGDVAPGSLRARLTAAVTSTAFAH
ncbi:MAG: hypothetical protein ACKV2T_39500 [Kofleriaceae bacterium]